MVGIPVSTRMVNGLGGEYEIIVSREDFSPLYPGMIRYTVEMSAGERVISRFRTNTYEYSPIVPLSAETVAYRIADEWEEEIRGSPDAPPVFPDEEEPPLLPGHDAEVLIIQGSPRADGNCAILAGWVADEAGKLGRKATVIFPNDLDIHPCIGCYQCYNTGTCTFRDDMDGIIASIRKSRLLVCCSPVYTDTVPSALKALIDRCQALHAALMTGSNQGTDSRSGVILSVCGRKGLSNFTCVTKVLCSYMQNLGIRFHGKVLFDGMDVSRDVRTLPGAEEQVRKMIRTTFSGGS
jgi:multimeric flavodoxin WrbA